MIAYEIDPNITQARTLPGSFYSDAEAHERLKDTAFTRSWQWFAVREAAPKAGSIFPFTLLENWLDEPLVLSRDLQGNLRCLSNVCTHRGNLIALARGQDKALRCRYHGRRFSLDGKCEHAPGFDGVSDFPSERDHLPSLPLGLLGRLLFTSIAPDNEFGDWTEGLTERISFMPLESFQLDSGRSKTYTFDANWALYVDNFLEGFHIPFVHPALNQALNFREYKTVLLPYGNVQIAPAAEGQPHFDLPVGHPDYGQKIAAYFFWLFPNLMLNFYPWGLSLNVVEPQGLNKTRVRFLSYVWQPQYLGIGAGADINRLEMEDEDIVLSVQKGVKARMYGAGRYSPRYESGLHQFHRMLSKALE